MIALGQPAFETAVEGNGALQSGWFDNGTMCIKPDDGTCLNHYQQYKCGWSTADQVCRATNAVVDVIRNSVGPGVDIPDIPLDEIEDVSSFTIAQARGPRGPRGPDRLVGGPQEVFAALDSSVQEQLEQQEEIKAFLEADNNRDTLSRRKLAGSRQSIEAAERKGNAKTGM